MKLSEKLKRCLDGDNCADCKNFENNSVLTCRKLLQKVYEKIKGYEELEEQCVNENSWCLRMLLHKWKEFIDDIQELYEYRKLDEEKKLLRLPCAVEDIVYTNCSMQGWYFRKENRPYAAKIVFIGFNRADNYINIDFGNGHMLQFRFSDIGKTVFLTKSEAEAALQKMNEMEGEE